MDVVPGADLHSLALEARLMSRIHDEGVSLIDTTERFMIDPSTCDAQSILNRFTNLHAVDPTYGQNVTTLLWSTVSAVATLCFI